jgi:hypothetical protein
VDADHLGSSEVEWYMMRSSRSQELAFYTQL